MGREAVGLHARGTVLKSYAYGLHGPVCNIVLNSLWYESTFPAASPSDVLEPMMLSCNAIFRMARRSLDALVAFIRAYAPALSAQDAMFYLHRSHGNLHRAAVLIDTEGVDHKNGMEDALRAAILAAHLPGDVARQANFSFVVNSAPIDAFLARHGISGHSLAFGLYDLSSRNNASVIVDGFVKSVMSRLVCTVSSPPSSSILRQGAHRASRIKRHYFKRDQEFCLNIVNMALDKLAFQFGKRYRIHLLCGKSLVTLLPNSYYHVNFMASLEDEPTQPKLFFAEVCASHKDVNHVTLCCPVTLSATTGGCSACEFTGMKLIHPIDEEFNGQHDFTKGFDPHMVERFRKDPNSEFGVPLIEEYIFFEPDQHPEVRTFLETTYADMSDDQVDLSLLWFGNCLP
ncbi:uncharacterized protein LOC112271679 [Brachypodium distachyon]|nr:uncharacterized protein LOC112271679 [Brachypodium distachyon]|eukprot:XP_024317196.1 uncharacterized protein LOC112271679 [Brachypodium distachyon]